MVFNYYKYCLNCNNTLIYVGNSNDYKKIIESVENISWVCNNCSGNMILQKRTKPICIQCNNKNIEELSYYFGTNIWICKNCDPEEN